MGRLEDPAEDVFVSSIATPRGNFRILQGVWESNSFYVQRVVNALESIPADGRFDQMRNCVYALLSLSDVVCERAGLTRHQLGNVYHEKILPKKIAESGRSFGKVARFTEADFAAVGISVDDLADFVFDSSMRRHLAEETIGHSTLERFPIAHRNGQYFLLLPTAVGTAIRRYIIDEMDALALRDESAETLAFEYAHLFSNTPLLGKGSGAQIGFEKTDSGLLAGGVARIDTGLYLNLIFFSDTLEGFANGGLTGWFPGAQSRELAEEVDRRIDEACEDARAETDFREGITLLVGCGIGRAIVDFTSDRQWEDWRFEFVGASDLITLSWLPDFTPLSLWRLLEGQHRVEQAGVELHNINGLLNMVGWARSLGGHLVPHGDLPDEFGDSNIPTFIMIEQNALLQVRYEVATYWDHHVVQNILGRWIGVRKDGGSLFREDQQLPFFMAEERDGSRWLRGVYETVSRTWWCELETPDGTPGHQAYERSKLLKTWMCRIVPVLETDFPELPTGTLLWRSRFEGNIGDWGEKVARSRLTFDDAKSTISVEVDKASRIVSVVADALFEDAIFHPENIAERALVTGAVEGFARLASAKPSADRNDELVQKIAGDVSARQSHAFRAQQFRDFVRDSVWRAPITVDKDDAAILKLGVGWRARRRELGGDIRGKDECTIFLNEIVRLLED